VRTLIIGWLVAGAMTAPRRRRPTRTGLAYSRATGTATGHRSTNGPLQPSWEVPPYTWPKNQLQCNPVHYVCYPAVRP